MYLLNNLKWIVSVIVVFGEFRTKEATSRADESLSVATSSRNTTGSYRRLTDDFDPNFINNKKIIGIDRFPKHNDVMNVDVSAKNLPSRRVCGPLSEEERIFGGENAAIDEFPWLVQIKYVLDSGKEVYACAGSLITDYYVITAAHCAVNLTIKEVRLGEWNVETAHDCHEGVCSGAPVDVKVTRVTPYPGYNKMDTFKGDLALLKLQRRVNFTDFIRPICLPTSESTSNQDYTPGSLYWTAGWGKTEFAKKSAVKRKVELESVPISECRLKQPGLSDVTAPFVICAGGTKGRDTCVGDSGGSLVKQVHDGNSTNWYLMGLTSYGYKECGTEGRPGLYARIKPYMHWILENID